MEDLPNQRQPPSSTKSSLGINRDQQVEKLLKEVKQLKQKVDVLDKENIALKKSIYDLSARYAATISQGGLPYRAGPFVIDNEVTPTGKEMLSKVVQEASGDMEPFQSSKKKEEKLEYISFLNQTLFFSLPSRCSRWKTLSTTLRIKSKKKKKKLIVNKQKSFSLYTKI